MRRAPVSVGCGRRAPTLSRRRYSTAAPAAAAPSAAVPKVDVSARIKEEISLAGRAEVNLVKGIIGGLDLARTKLAAGHNLTRRERIAVSRSFADLGRLVPLSAIIVVPFAELALPWLSKTFPSIVPSSHVAPSIADLRAQQREEEQRKISSYLLHEAEHELAHHAKGDTATAFQKLLEQGGRHLHVREFHPLLKFFAQHFGLKQLSHAKLQAIASFFGVHTEGTDSFLRASILARLAELREDDTLIHEQGIDTLTDAELRDALVARGTPASGKSREERLKALRDWFHLSEHGMTPYLLVLTRAEAYTAEELQHAHDAIRAAHEAEKRATTVAGLVQNF